MNWFDVLKDARLASKGKAIDIDSVKPIESQDEDCIQDLVKYLVSKGYKISRHRPQVLEFENKNTKKIFFMNEAYLALPHKTRRPIDEEVYCDILEDLKRIKVLETNKVKDAVLPAKQFGQIYRHSLSTSYGGELRYDIRINDVNTHVLIIYIRDDLVA